MGLSEMPLQSGTFRIKFLLQHNALCHPAHTYFPASSLPISPLSLTEGNYVNFPGRCISGPLQMLSRLVEVNLNGTPGLVQHGCLDYTEIFPKPNSLERVLMFCSIYTSPFPWLAWLIHSKLI